MSGFFAEETLFLGKDLLPWLLFAFGSAMVVGNLMAMFRPPPEKGSGSAGRSGASSSKSGAPAAEPNRNRMITMIVIGAVVAIWSGVSLFK